MNLKNASFTNVEVHDYMFDSVSPVIQIIVKDATAQLWIQERLSEIGNAGTVIIA